MKFYILLLTIFVCENASKELQRILLGRVRSYSSTKSNCTVSNENITTCKTNSRTFGKISVVKSSAYESLINEADSYFIRIITIGTPAQSFLIDFDTDSSDLWISSRKCSSSSCANFDKYTSSKSTTYKANGKTFSITYGDGSSAKVQNQTFAECTSLTGMSDDVNDGIFGPALHTVLEAIYDSTSGLYKVNCLTRTLSSFPNVTFNNSGKVFTLTVLNYRLIYQESDYFLYRYYSIFDIVNNLVGFVQSISYNWTQTVPSSLFSATTTTTKKTTTKRCHI